ncbi:MAG: DUF3368 domain-containing protein [Pseudomonadota bacterium]
MIAFAIIDRLSILKTLFAEVWMTESVRDECLAKSGVDAQRINISIVDGWLVVRSAGIQSKPLSPSLGSGESDAIRFAMESPEDTLLIMDDRLARRYALSKGLNIVGTVRLLDLAEQRGVIESAEQYIQEMVGFGYRISLDLLKKIRSES